MDFWSTDCSLCDNPLPMNIGLTIAELVSPIPKVRKSSQPLSLEERAKAAYKWANDRDTVTALDRLLDEYPEMVTPADEGQLEYLSKLLEKI